MVGPPATTGLGVEPGRAELERMRRPAAPQRSSCRPDMSGGGCAMPGPWLPWPARTRRSAESCARSREGETMEKTEIWPVIHAEREALAIDLGAIGPDQWASPSLCGSWTVRDVVAHMTATAKMTPPAFLVKLAGAGFSFDRLQERNVAAERGATPADTFRRFQAELTSVKHPPGPVDSWLGETIVHAEDIRRPLGIRRHYPPEAVIRTADFYKGSNRLIGTKRRIAGLTLRATDADWSYGNGPQVSGPMLSLPLAMTGRKDSLSDLSGDGIAVLGERA